MTLAVLEVNKAVTIGVGQIIVFKSEMDSMMKIGSWKDLSKAEYSYDLASGIWSNAIFTVIKQ